jgi:hypothetical protein
MDNLISVIQRIAKCTEFQNIHSTFKVTYLRKESVENEADDMSCAGRPVYTMKQMKQPASLAELGGIFLPL